jgi:hypothetical protein
LDRPTSHLHHHRESQQRCLKSLLYDQRPTNPYKCTGYTLWTFSYLPRQHGYIQATQSGQLPLHILSGITNSSLISIGQLCDNDCIAVLDKHKHLPYLAYGDSTKNALVQIVQLLAGRASAPLTLPIAAATDLTGPHPPRVQISPRMRVPIHPPRVHIPIHPPTVQLPQSPPLTSPQKVQPKRVTPPRVQNVRHQMSLRVQRCHASNPTNSCWQSLQHLQAVATFRHLANHIYNDKGKKETMDTLLAGKTVQHGPLLCPTNLVDA